MVHPLTGTALTYRTGRLLITVGYVIVGVGAAMFQWAVRLGLPTPTASQWYELAIAISALLIAWAWWPITKTLSDPHARQRIRQPLRLFACGNAVLALGYIGETRDVFVPFSRSYPLTSGLIVITVGLWVLAVGFWQISSGGERSHDVIAGSAPDDSLLEGSGFSVPMERRLVRVPRMLMLTGFIVSAIGTAISEWNGSPWSVLDAHRGYLAYDVSVVVSLGLIGWAWWYFVAELPIPPLAKNQLHLSFRMLAIASGIVAIANAALLSELSLTGFLPHAFAFSAGCVTTAIGLGAVSLGFWRTAGVVAGSHVSVITRVPAGPSKLR